MEHESPCKKVSQEIERKATFYSREMESVVDRSHNRSEEAWLSAALR